MRSLLVALLLAWSALLQAADLSESHILVARPELKDQLYGSSILVVKPIGGDQHVGFIVNRPTGVPLAKAFPDHGPSQKIVDPVYLGGPVEAQLIFALVQQVESPGGNSLEVLPGLYAAIDGPIVDRIIESRTAARFVAGLVVWRAGELADEIKQGAWYVLEPDAGLALSAPEGLWDELARRSRMAQDAI